MINGKLLFGLLINAAMTAFVAIEERVLLYVMGPFLALSLLGAALLLLGHARRGAQLVIAGSIGFIPAGLVAVLGARDVLDSLSQQELEARRQRA